MSTKSYSNVWTVQKQIEYIGKRLDKYAKFYWRGEDMWATYHTFITNNGSALKFVNGPSFSNEYSSPQYDHAMGNLTGVKFSRMQVTFPICSYGVTAAEYRSLVAAFGPYEIDYLAFDYDNKLCYLAKTIGMKDAVKTVIGQNSSGEDLYLVENNITFEIQGEQCALAQRQYVWSIDSASDGIYVTVPTINSDDMLPTSEISFGIVGEIALQIPSGGSLQELELYVTTAQQTSDITQMDLLCHIDFNKITSNWQNTQVDSASEQQQPTSLLPIDHSLSFKYDSTSGLVFMQYGESDYKMLNLLLTNTYGEYLIKDMKTIKMKINKYEDVGNIRFVWRIKTELTISIRRPSGDGSSYIKQIDINNDTYLFKADGNYEDLPSFKSSGILEERQDDVQLKEGGQFSFTISNDDAVRIIPYQQNHVEYSLDGENYQLMSDTNPGNWSTFEPELDVNIDEGATKVYGRAKAILV